LLGAPLKDVLELLPRGPRVVLLEIDRVVDYSLVEAERGSLIIGVERPGVSFVTVLDKEIARTENDVGVGTSEKDLRNVMGPESRAPNLLRDPRILVFDYLPNARFVMQDGAVAAIMVGERGRPPTEGPSEQPSTAGEDDQGRDAGAAGKQEGAPCELLEGAEQEAEALRVARVEESEGPARVVPGCFGGGAVALVHTNHRLVVVAKDHDKLRRGPSQNISNLTFAGPIDVDGDGRAEIGVVSHPLEAGVLTVHIDIFKLEGSRLQRLFARDAYKVTAVSATWIGARLDQIDLLLDLSARFETLYLGGLYVQRRGDRVRNVAPLHRLKLALRPKRPPTGTALPAEGGRPDAGVPAIKTSRKRKVDASVPSKTPAKAPSRRDP